MAGVRRCPRGARLAARRARRPATGATPVVALGSSATRACAGAVLSSAPAASASAVANTAAVRRRRGARRESVLSAIACSSAVAPLRAGPLGADAGSRPGTVTSDQGSIAGAAGRGPSPRRPVEGAGGGGRARRPATCRRPGPRALVVVADHDQGAAVPRRGLDQPGHGVRGRRRWSARRAGGGGARARRKAAGGGQAEALAAGGCRRGGPRRSSQQQPGELVGSSPSGKVGATARRLARDGGAVVPRSSRRWGRWATRSAGTWMRASTPARRAGASRVQEGRGAGALARAVGPDERHVRRAVDRRPPCHLGGSSAPAGRRGPRGQVEPELFVHRAQARCVSRRRLGSGAAAASTSTSRRSPLARALAGVGEDLRHRVGPSRVAGQRATLVRSRPAGGAPGPRPAAVPPGLLGGGLLGGHVLVEGGRVAAEHGDAAVAPPRRWWRRCRAATGRGSPRAGRQPVLQLVPQAGAGVAVGCWWARRAGSPARARGAGRPGHEHHLPPERVAAGRPGRRRPARSSRASAARSTSTGRRGVSRCSGGPRRVEGPPARRARRRTPRQVGDGGGGVPGGPWSSVVTGREARPQVAQVGRRSPATGGRCSARAVAPGHRWRRGEGDGDAAQHPGCPSGRALVDVVGGRRRVRRSVSGRRRAAPGWRWGWACGLPAVGAPGGSPSGHVEQASARGGQRTVEQLRGPPLRGGWTPARSFRRGRHRRERRPVDQVVGEGERRVRGAIPPRSW